MQPSLRPSSLLFVGLWTLAGCSGGDQAAAGTTTALDRLPPESAPLESSTKAVVVFSATVREFAGGGRSFGALEPGVVVTTGELNEGWREISAAGPPPIRGWVRQNRLGCRVVRTVELDTLDEAKPEVTLRPGALLAVRSEGDDLVEVETQGAIVIRGRIERSACGVGAPFTPTLPRDGVPHRLIQATSLTSELSGETPIPLPEGQRFAVFLNKGQIAYGRTDGPVVIRGLVDARFLERDKRTPFDRLAEPLGYTHEVVLEAPLFSAPGKGRPFTALPGGTPLNVEGRDHGWSQIETHGNVRLQGWVEDLNLRRVSLDYNDLDPYARRREHYPTQHDVPRSGEEPEE